MYDPKEVVAKYALSLIEDRKVIGLGTGKTVRKLIELLAKEGYLEHRSFITSSVDTDLQVSKISPTSVISPFSGVIPEIYIDSFDFLIEGEKGKILIKGGGGALLREKVLSFFSKYRVFIGETSKMFSGIAVNVPVEIVPAAFSLVRDRLSFLGFRPTPRESNGKIGPLVTDNGNVIIDIYLPTDDLCDKEKELRGIPGIVETGIFCENLYDTIVVGDEEGRIQVFQRGRDGS
ncbi:ribose 5-phosphate isomerase A [Metallosphaera tengchongensis]|uniref:Ribose 5-phosphate isomerase A n=1 Tax=Metallosphaera tengchongensis TaxID=1532350 RepID=A0A6N0NSZ5_9CREN|nr:ribose 5-phosphate isomerase A [Metallosphaera tengchongensis]QKQ99865.1 ribose 5-phosphate isomerase A [Metallosphaera tengchongensis]